MQHEVSKILLHASNLEYSKLYQSLKVIRHFSIKDHKPGHYNLQIQYSKYDPISTVIFNTPPSVCVGLPEQWTALQTDAQFPVSIGTVISVSCSPGYTHTGDTLVTCNTEVYLDLQYTNLPGCTAQTFTISKCTVFELRCAG